MSEELKNKAQKIENDDTEGNKAQKVEADDTEGNKAQRSSPTTPKATRPKSKPPAGSLWRGREASGRPGASARART